MWKFKHKNTGEIVVYDTEKKASALLGSPSWIVLEQPKKPKPKKQVKKDED